MVVAAGDDIGVNAGLNVDGRGGRGLQGEALNAEVRAGGAEETFETDGERFAATSLPCERAAEGGGAEVQFAPVIAAGAVDQIEAFAVHNRREAEEPGEVDHLAVEERVVTEEAGDVGAPFGAAIGKFLGRDVGRRAQIAGVLRRITEMFFERAADMKIAAALGEKPFVGERGGFLEVGFDEGSGFHNVGGW